MDVSYSRMSLIKLIEKKRSYAKEIQEMNKLGMTGDFIDELREMINELDIKIKQKQKD